MNCLKLKVLFKSDDVGEQNCFVNETCPLCPGFYMLSFNECEKRDQYNSACVSTTVKEKRKIAKKKLFIEFYLILFRQNRW